MLIVKNLNPFSLSRDVTDKTKHEMVYMLWRECIPSDFNRYICNEKNFIYLNGRDVGQPGVLEIVGGFIENKISECFKNIWRDSKTSISAFIRMFSLEHIRHQRKEVSI